MHNIVETGYDESLESWTDVKILLIQWLLH